MATLEEHHQWLLSTGHFSDLTVHARGAGGSASWQLHRSVVVRSPYFQRMLTGDWDEAKKQEIDLDCHEVPGLTVDGLKSALNYLYGKKLVMSSMEALAEGVIALKFLLLDDAVQDLLKTLDDMTPLPCKDWQSLTASAALYRETMPGLWKVVLEALSRDPIWVLDHVSELHPEFLIALVNHSSLRIFKDISRYRFGEEILKELERSGGCGASCASPVSPFRARATKRSRKNLEEPLRSRIFQGFPDWELSSEQVHLIRQQGLVPDRLLLDWWEHQPRVPVPSVTRGFEVRVTATEVITSIPSSWRRLHESSTEMEMKFGTTCPLNGRIHQPFFFSAQKSTNSNDKSDKLSFYCNLVVEGRHNNRQMLLGLQVFEPNGRSRARFEHRSWRDVGTRRLKFGGLELDAAPTELFVVATLPAGVFALEMSPLPAT